MHVMLRLPHFAALLLLAVPCAGAETPFTDPIPPAVVGRPIHQIQPTQPAQPSRPKPLVTKPRPTTPVASTPAVTKPAAKKSAAAKPVRAAKAAVDDRADPRARGASEVGKGRRFARKPLDPGAYISSKYRALVRQYYEAHPSSAKGTNWKIGEPVPRKASLASVPDELRARLPVVPPGLQYAQVGGEVVLLAVQSRMVVDGVSRN